MGTPLLLDKDACQALKKYAEEHPLDVEMMKEMAAGQASWIDNYWIHLPHKDTPISYVIGLTIEKQPQKDGEILWMMHFSFMSPAAGRWVTPTAVDIVLGDFYPGLHHKQAVDATSGTYGDGEHKGKNFIELWFIHENSREYWNKKLAEADAKKKEANG